MALTKTWAGRKTGLVILRIDSLHELKIPAPDTRPIMFHINLVVITYSCRKWPKIKIEAGNGLPKAPALSRRW